MKLLPDYIRMRTYTPPNFWAWFVLKMCTRSCCRNNITNRPLVGRKKASYCPKKRTVTSFFQWLNYLENKLIMTINDKNISKSTISNRYYTCKKVDSCSTLNYLYIIHVKTYERGKNMDRITELLTAATALIDSTTTLMVKLTLLVTVIHTFF